MDPFLGQTICVAFNQMPRGWAQCNGQLLPINQNQALFSLLGTTYGGDGINNFALPNLQGRAGLSTGNGINLGQTGGEEMHTLALAELPQHAHPMGAASAAASTKDLTGTLLADTSGSGPAIYASGASPKAVMNPAAAANQGGGQSHENRQPYTVMNWIIALVGVFPSRP